MIVTRQPTPFARRSAFTLLEVLVVVAIIVILAGGAGVYVFGYLEDARIDTAQNTMLMLEKACVNYATKNGGIPPNSLLDLVQPTDGRRPLVDGGLLALQDPWGKQFQYDPTNVNGYGDPDPIVSTTTPNGQPLFSTKRK